MQYFKDCQTVDEAKKRFFQLAMKMHPDRCGFEIDSPQYIKVTEDFKILVAQFESFRPSGKAKYNYTDKDGNVRNEHEEFINKNEAKEFVILIDLLFRNFPYVTIEVRGSYLWLHDTKKGDYKKIKAFEVEGLFRCRWNNFKKKVYFMPWDYRPKKRKNHSMEEIRDMFSGGTVKKEEEQSKLS